MERLVDPPAGQDGGLTVDALPEAAVPVPGGALAVAGSLRPGTVRACLLALLLALAGGAPEAAAKPNIVLIVVDDMEVGLVGRMPVVKERIIDQGATFTRAYFNNPLCCPSRATILTGRYAQNTGVTQNSHELFHANGNPARTVAVWLKAAGYRTALVGKYLNGYPIPAGVGYVPPGWDFWVARKGGDGKYYEYKTVEMTSAAGPGVVVTYGSDPAAYSTDVYARKALQFVDRSLAEGAPFLLFFAPHAPHAPHTPALRHANLLLGLGAPKPASFNEADVRDKPAYVRAKPALTPAEVAGTDRNYRDRARSLLAVDEAVRAIFDRVQAAGQLGNTYFVFMSDNGWLYGQHRLKSKGYPYEEAVRIPLHVRGPGVAAGRTIGALVGNADLAPTLAAWAGARVPGDLDGRSLAPLLAGGPGPRRQAVGIASQSPYNGVPAWRGVRTATHTYARYSTGETELYDNVADPLQLRNLAGGIAVRALQGILEERSTALADCEASRCRALEDAPLR